MEKANKLLKNYEYPTRVEDFVSRPANWCCFSCRYDALFLLGKENQIRYNYVLHPEEWIEPERIPELQYEYITEMSSDSSGDRILLSGPQFVGILSIEKVGKDLKLKLTSLVTSLASTNIIQVRWHPLYSSSHIVVLSEKDKEGDPELSIYYCNTNTEDNHIENIDR